MSESFDGADGLGAERSGEHHGSEPVAGAMPLRPAPPLAKRLNRNALTVAAALGGVTVITVLVVTRPLRPGVADASQAIQHQTPPVPAHPAFLDQPPKPLPIDSAQGEIALSERGGGALQQRSANGMSGAAGPNAAIDSRTQLPVPPPLDESPAPNRVVAGDGLQAVTSSPRHQAYEAALTSSVIVRAVQTRATESSPVTDRSAGISGNLEVPSGVPGTTASPSDDSRAPAGSGAAEPLTAGISSASAPTPGPPVPATSVIAVRLDSAGSPYTVRAGTVIPGLLVTGVNSDLPGEVLGQTSRDVYDSRTQSILLVPKGSRLIGSYDSRSVGTGRLIVSWTRLILPDGRSMVLPRLAGTDAQGQAGLHDEVDHHYGRVYGAALLTSALTAGVQLSQPQQSALYAAPSTRQVAAGALGQTMGDVALESARRGLDIPPTIVIRPGQPFNVFLAGDLAFAGPDEADVIAKRP